MIVGDQDPGHDGRGLRAVLDLLSAVALAMTLSVAPAGADDRGPLVLTGPAEVEALSRHFDYTIDPGREMTAADFAGPDAVAMEPVTGPVPDFGYTTAKIWLRLPVVNATTAVNDWRFHVQVGFIQEIAIYRIGSDGAITTLLELHEQSPFSDRPIDYPQIVVPIAVSPGEAATILVSYYGIGASRHAMSIETPTSFADIARVATAKNFAFYGMMLVIIALATVALITLREPVFAAYAAYLASILIYIAHGDGVAFQYLWPAFPQFSSMAASVWGSAALVFGGLFAMTFLETKRQHPIMHRVLLTVVGSILVLAAVLLFTDLKLLNRVLVYLALISVLTYLAAGIVAARTRFREVRFYVFSWTASLIPAVLFTARFAFGYVPTFITTYDAIRLALVLDALMMGLAIFDRYNYLRQSAMEETLAHTKRNLALSQRLGALEERYEEATAIARQREESVKDTVHDLRQPMHALRLSLRQMLTAQGEKQIDAGQIESALSYMERLVAERLADRPETTASKAIDEGASEPGLHSVLRGVADMFTAEAREKGLRLKLVLAAPDGAVAAYPLMRVVSNLVSNAIKYTREGRVVIALRRSERGHRIEVHDTGPGLSGASFEEALVRSQRLERDRNAAEGSGLGLAVVKEIAEANNWAVSSCEDRRTGTSIRMDLSPAPEFPLGGRG